MLFICWIGVLVVVVLYALFRIFLQGKKLLYKPFCSCPNIYKYTDVSLKDNIHLRNKKVQKNVNRL